MSELCGCNIQKVSHDAQIDPKVASLSIVYLLSVIYCCFDINHLIDLPIL